MGEKNVRRYIRQIKRLYTGNHKAKKKFINELKDALLCYCEKHESATYSDLLSEFGSPSDMKDMLSFHTAKDLHKRNLLLYWMIITITTIILLLAVWFTIKHIKIMLDYSNGYYIEYYEDNTSVPKNRNPLTNKPDPTPIKHVEFD